MVYNHTPPGSYHNNFETIIEKSVVKRSGNHVGFFMLMYFAVSFLWQYIYMAVMLMMGYSYMQIVSVLSDTMLLLFINILLTTIVFIGAGWVCSKMEHIPIKNLISIDRPKKGLFLPALLMGIGFCYVANIATSLFSNNISWLIEPKGQDISLPTGPIGIAMSVISIAAFPALLEEFAMRGIIMGSLQRFGKSFAILASAIIFGLLHGNLVQIPFAFLVGLVLGYIVFETGSLWTGIAVHFFNNLFSVLLQYLSEELSEKNMNLLSSVVLIFFIGLGLIGFYLLTHRVKNSFCFEKTPHSSTTKQRLKWLFSAPVMVFFVIMVALSVALVQLTALLPQS